MAGKHQGSHAHLGESSAQPEVARIGLTMHAAAAVDGCTAAVELSTSCEAGDGWYGFGGTTRRWWLCWLGAGVLREVRTMVAVLYQSSIVDTRSVAAEASAAGPELENERAREKGGRSGIQN